MRAGRIFEGVGIALDSLRSNKVRAALTILGVAIGVMVVIAMASMVTGINRGVEKELESLGPKTFMVNRFFQGGLNISDGSDELSPWRRNPWLTVEEARMIRRLPTVREVAWREGTSGPVSYGDQKLSSVNVTGFSASWTAVQGGAMAPTVFETAPARPMGSDEQKIATGRRLFNTGLGRWSLKGQGWTGCQSCHMDGYSDNVSWFFARGPRQSTSLDGSFSKKDPSDQRLFNWTAIFDEVADFEGNTRGISGGVGAIVKDKALDVANRIDTANVEGANHGGLFGGVADVADPSNPLGLAAPSVLDDWANITAFVQAIRPPRAATNLDAAKVAAGKALFASDGSCQGCHGGDKWTISKRFHAPAVDTSAALLTTAWTPPASFPAALLPAATPANRFMRFQNGNAAAFDQFQCILRPVGTFDKADAVTGILEKRQDMTTAAQGNQTDGNGYNPPSLYGVALGAPYLHGGQAATLESLFSTTFATHYQALAPNFLADADPAARAQKVDQLVQYLLSIDEGTPSLGIPAAGAGGGNFCAP